MTLDITQLNKDSEAILAEYPRRGFPYSKTGRNAVRGALVRMYNDSDIRPPDVPKDQWPPGHPCEWLMERVKRFAVTKEGTDRKYITVATKFFNEGGYLMNPVDWGEANTEQTISRLLGESVGGGNE